jgi:hypothetical protein
MKPRCFLQFPGFFMIMLAALCTLTSCDRKNTLMNPNQQPPPVSNTTPTLTDIQNKIFTPRCAFSGCHGDQGTQPGAQPQNLSAGKAYNSIVNVASLQRPDLMRVMPGDPVNSYLVRKLEAGAGIVGSIMPVASNQLDPALIKMVKDWIAAGAPNN